MEGFSPLFALGGKKEKKNKKRNGGGGATHLGHRPGNEGFGRVFTGMGGKGCKGAFETEKGAAGYEKWERNGKGCRS